MARNKRTRSRPRAVETAALVWSIWRWLPPSEKRRVILLVRRHGPWIVSGALRYRRPRR